VTGTPPIYEASPLGPGASLRQGEILSDLDQFRLDVSTLSTDSIAGQPFRHPFAVLLTQDCDLEQDFTARQKGEVTDKLLPGLLFCQVAKAEELFSRLGGRRKEWERMNVDKNKNERYHFLQKVDASCDAQQVGIDELGIDFKRYVTVPAAEVYRRIELGEAKRRCVLKSPYLEHFSSRFAYFLSRVALPLDHASD
jgi:hypothetical protein